MSTCYIVGAGELTRLPHREAGDLIIAADGGLDGLLAGGILPDLLIGDMDSKSRDFSGETIVFPVRKDETDSFLAYREGVKRGYRDFVLLGGTGGREDHTFANISLLLYAKKQGHSVKMIGKQNSYSLILDGEDVFSGEALSHISVFALGGNAEGVTVRGAEYEAENITLTPEYPLGASNRFVGEPVFISVERGALLIITENTASQN